MATPATRSINVRAKPVGDDTQQRLLYKIDGILATGAGLGGVDWVTDTGVYAGDWGIFHAVSDSVIAAITYAPNTASGSAVGQTIKAGDRIYGYITSFQLASGSGELYRNSI